MAPGVTALAFALATLGFGAPSRAESPGPSVSDGASSGAMSRRGMLHLAAGPVLYESVFDDLTTTWHNTGAGVELRLLLGFRAFDGVTLGLEVNNSVLPLFESSGSHGYNGNDVSYSTSLLTFVGAFCELDRLGVVPARGAPASIHYTASLGALVLSQGHGPPYAPHVNAKGWGGTAGVRYEFAEAGRVRWGVGAHFTAGHVYDGSVDSFQIDDADMGRSEWLISPALELSVTYR